MKPAIKHHVLLMIFIATFWGCNGQTYQKVEIDLFGEIGNLHVSIEQIVPLETTDQSLIGDISRVRYHDGNFYVLDRLVAQNLLLFDKDGRFLNRLQKGRGPGEVLMPFEFIIDATSETVFVWDPGNRSLNEYDLNLNFRRGEYKEDLFITRAEDIGNGLWLINGPVIANEEDGKLTYYGYSIYDVNQGRYLSQFFPIRDELSNIIPMRPISVFQDRVLFSTTFSNYLYSLYDFENGKYRKEYQFNFGSFTLQNYDIQKGIEHVYEEAMRGRRIIPFYGIGENRDFISFNYSIFARDNFMLFSKTTGNSFDSEAIFQANLLPRSRLIGNVGDNLFLALAYPDDVLRFYSNQSDVPEAIYNLHKMSNPILIVFSAKENGDSLQ